MLPIYCLTCQHYEGDSRCPAFPAPAEIPYEIMVGEIKHDHVLPGQVGDFVRIEGESAEMRRHQP